MFRSSIMLLATMLCVSCVSHRPIQDSSSPPIDAANPLDGTPVALAWSSGTQLMMGVDTGAVQTSLLFSPAVESIGARLRGRGAMRTANVPVSLKDDGEPISRKQDVVMADQAPYRARWFAGLGMHPEICVEHQLSQTLPPFFQ